MHVIARLAIALAITITAVACTCETPAAERPAEARVTEAAPAAIQLAPATRSDLPAALRSALVLGVRADGFDVDPTALVTTAEAQDRVEAAGLTAQLVRVPAPGGDALEVPALTDA
ncbi:MAG: hypothetical protein M3Y87_35845, partial [Myxococcota bacterium]|nr:hypothetical protein [Myxococcota bacterium]